MAMYLGDQKITPAIVDIKSLEYINHLKSVINGTATTITSDDLKGMTKIGNYKFEDYSNLIDVELPEGITLIDSHAFVRCNNLVKIKIPKTLTEIDENAFSGTSKLSSIYIDDLTAWCNIRFYNSGANPLVSGKNLYLNGELVTSLIIPSAISIIKQYTFSHCSITSLTIPVSITNIDNEAFYYCQSLSNITYEGTISQWNAIRKVTGWNSGAPATYIQCTDGQIQL